MPAQALAGVVLLLLSAFANAADERGAAARFILEKLGAQHGENWDRVGREFLWNYRFQRANCELRVQRDAPYAAQFVQVIPIDASVPYWDGHGALRFICQGDGQCISERSASPQHGTEQRWLGEAHLLVMDPDDLPKLRDAFARLHSLCDDPYRAPDPPADALAR